MFARVVFAFAVIYLVWGSTYLGIRVALESIPPFLMAGTRFLVAGGLLYGWARFRGAARPERTAWRGALILGGLMFLLGNGLIVWAELRVDSGLVALVASGTPAWVVVIDHLRPGGRRATAAKWIGVALGVTGLAILFLPNASGSPTLDLLGAAAVLTASASWGVGSIAARGLALPKDPTMASGITMLAGGALLMGMAAASGELGSFSVAAVSGRSLAAWTYLVFFGSILAFTCFTWLLHTVDPLKVATSGLVNPLVALVLGAWLADEVVGRQAVLAAAVTLAGLALILRAPEIHRIPPSREVAEPAPQPDASPAPAEAAAALGGSGTRAAA